MSGTRGSSGLGSVSIEQIERSTAAGKMVSSKALVMQNIDAPFEIVNAGDHWSLRMSRQIEPLALMFGW